MSRVALLLCLAAVSEGAKRGGFQKIPQFYTSSDCSGPIDSESKTWSMNAKDNVAVMPFKTEGDYMQSWVFDKCLAGAGAAYSVKVTVNETACGAKKMEDQLVLNYYAGGTCGVTPLMTSLTANKCVPYSRGSVKLVTEIPLNDLCTMTQFVTAMRTGGTKTEIWRDTDSCKGTPINTEEDKGNVKECGAEPECEGCCQTYEECKPVTRYEFNLQACTPKGNSWRYGLKVREYNDSGCKKEVDTPFENVIDPTQCTAVKLGKNNGSMQLTFLPPMSLDLMCKSLEVGLRHNIDPSIVSWSELNGGVASVPHILLTLFALVFAALL